MVSHQAVRVAEPAEPVDDVGERLQKPKPIGVVAVDRRALVPARDYVIDGARDADPQRPGHTMKLRQQQPAASELDE
jgi:hypothetical protein